VKWGDEAASLPKLLAIGSCVYVLFV